MKSLYTFLVACLIAVTGFSQTINIAGFNFQGYAIDNEGKAITSESVTVTFTIGNFEETHSLTTDAFGVFNTVIGSNKKTEFRELDFKTPYEGEVLSLKVQVQKNSGAQVTIYNGPLQSVPYARSAENGVPVGTIIAYSGATAPKGWLLCDGTEKKTDDYPRLSTALGSTWGTASANHFKLPDLRGRFLRGAGAGTTGLTGTNIPELGKTYGDQNKSHKHGVTVGDHSHNYDDIYYSESAGHASDHGVPTTPVNGNVGSGDSDGDNVGWIKSHPTHASKSTVTLANEGGVEARPYNAAVTYIIKY